ncbi:MAG: energy-coupling factor transporter transmembrane protein EcfT [Treponema sp.]|jgi:energy-coupling factor transport system permease protein|nr:energy-coupling factor transporter transmembrane protein EcfT [Treponema sp.]
MTGLLDYLPGNSPLHRLNPLTKLILSFTLCLVCFLTDRLVLILGVIIFNLALAVLAGVIGRSLKILGSLVKFSLVLFVVQIFFIRRGTAILVLPFNIFITDRGLLFSLLFVSRLIAATMPLTLMFSVTRMDDIANVLTRYFRIPYKYTFVLTTAIRFIPLFAEEMAGITEAQIARGIEFDTGNFFKKIRLLLPLCVPLLIASVRKIEGGAISAELRGFNLRKRKSGYKQYRFGPGDMAFFVFSLLLVLAARMI